MLKGISPIISPELLKLIAEMGHGDELVLADANFPGASIGKRCIRCDGHGCADVMRALLTLFPLDDFVTAPLAVMEVPQGMFPEDKAPIWKAFREAADTDLPTAQFDMMDHDAFMERARAAYARLCQGVMEAGAGNGTCVFGGASAWVLRRKLPAWAADRCAVRDGG